MKSYGMELAESPDGSGGIINLIIPSGNVFPPASNGELFIKFESTIEDGKLYTYLNGSWKSLVTTLDLTQYVASSPSVIQVDEMPLTGEEGNLYLINKDCFHIFDHGAFHHLASKRKQVTKLGVVVGQDFEVDISLRDNDNLDMFDCSILKFINTEGTTTVVSNTFTNDERDDFIEDEYALFDGSMHVETDNYLEMEFRETLLTKNLYQYTIEENKIKDLSVFQINDVSLDEQKTLFTDDTNVYTLSNNVWVNIGTLPFQDWMFNSGGLNELALGNITLSDINNFNSDLKIVTRVEGEIIPELYLECLFNGIVIVPTGFLAFKNVINFLSCTINTANESYGDIKIVFSSSAGNWKTWNGTGWSPIDINDVSAVKTYGMSVSGVLDLSAADTSNFFDTDDKFLAVAYYLENNSYLKQPLVKDIRFDVEMEGYWESAIHGVDYHYKFLHPKYPLITFLTAGDFKINY